MSVFTDYTESDNTFNVGFGQQTRIIKYIRDILLNWFADSRNIKDSRLLPLLYDRKGSLNKGLIKVDTPFNQDKRFSGTTPAVIINRGAIQYDLQPVNSNPGNPAFTNNPTNPIISQFRLKTFNVTITVITESHDGTDLLAELIQLFLAMNYKAIREDCPLLNAFKMLGVSQIQKLQQGQQGNAKQLYLTNITVLIGTHITWTEDTQGPVFNGIRLSSKFN